MTSATSLTTRLAVDVNAAAGVAAIKVNVPFGDSGGPNYTQGGSGVQGVGVNAAGGAGFGGVRATPGFPVQGPASAERPGLIVIRW